MGVIEDLARAREAYERREWVAAYETLSGPAEEALAADDFFRLAMSAQLLGRHNDSVQALQRAYQLHADADEVLAAARCSFWLAKTLLERGEAAIGNGWVATCRRLVDGVDEEVVEHGYVLTLELFQQIFSGQFEGTLELAEQVTACGRRFGDPDLLANGLNAQGRMLVYAGRVREGLALLDEAMVGIATGQVSATFSGETYCSLIEACQELSDFDRMAEWTSALTRWIDDQPGLVRFTGQCAVHRGQIMRLRGQYDAALEELGRAVDRYLANAEKAAAGVALAEQGDVLRIRGELAAADAAYARALELGFEPQPGLALLRLAQRRTDAAGAAIRRLLAEPRDPVHRSRLLPAAVDVLLAVGDDSGAGDVAEELDTIADSFGCRALRAMARQATGAVRLARASPAAALGDLRTALHDWQALDAPYDMARCRLLIGEALLALDDPESAAAELTGARDGFQRLGAVPEANRAVRLTARSEPGGLTARELEVLRLVAAGRTNPEIAAALVLSEKTVARHLSNIFTKLSVTSRTAAAAYAFEHQLV